MTTSSFAAVGGSVTPLPLTPNNNNLSINMQMKELQLLESRMEDSCQALRTSPHTLAAMRSLRESDMIVLFTPVVMPAGAMLADSPADQLDPFEHLGRALSQHHRRVRHVPYVHAVGLTDTHVAWMRHAAAIVTVTCTAAPKRNAFARDLTAMLAKVRSDADRVPLVKVMLYSSNSVDHTIDSGYGTVLQSMSYDFDVAERVAKTLFLSAKQA